MRPIDDGMRAVRWAGRARALGEVGGRGCRGAGARRLAVVGVSAGLVVGVLAGCGPSGSGSLGSGPTAPDRSSSSPATPPPTSGSPSGPASASSTPPATGGAPATSSSGRTIGFEVWLVRDGKIFVTRRTRPATPATARLALTTLIEGPTSAESGAGVTSAISAGTPFDVSLTGGVATVDLPARFYDGGRTLARLRQAQVAYTLTQYPTITKVGFLKDGAATSAPLSRADYADHLPPIVVAGPVIGQRVTNPVTISGTANVFEATVSIRIRDARGAQIATTFTTATCGSGCRGRYSVAVRYQVSGVQRGTVEVFSVSAADGSDAHLVRIPVTLAP